jgi:cell division protease FtsH
VEKYRRGEIGWSDVSSHAALIAGPPGVGKTVLARAIAKSANLPLVTASVSEWNSSSYLSGTLRSIDDSFRLARQLAPALLYIDEFDGISDRAKIRGEYREYWIQIVHRVMENMSGIQAVEGVAILASTNYPDSIDPALRRAGRLDRTIFIDRPSIEDLRMIFRFYLRDVLPYGDLMPLALAGIGGTGADVESWTRRARARARREGRELRIEDVLEIIRDGRRPLSKRLLKAVTVHESAHLVAGLALRIFSPEFLSLSDEGGMARVGIQIEDVQTLRDIEKIMVVLLSGRAAEEEFLTAAGVTAGGAGSEDSDLAKASRAAAAIELKLGFGTLGQIYFSDEAADVMVHDKEVLSAIKARLTKCYAWARRLVAANRDLIGHIAEHLAESGYLGKSEIERIVGDPRELADGIGTNQREKANVEDRG